jgi:hypothetical protein
MEPLTRVVIHMNDDEIIRVIVAEKYETVSADALEAWREANEEGKTFNVHGIDRLEILPVEDILRISVERVTA